MAGTIVVDRIESDASYASTINVAGQITFSNTVNFGATAQRITGDFSNATFANRLTFQTSTTNGVTSIGAIPNGTSVATNFSAFAATDPDNSSIARMRVDGTAATVIFEAAKNGTGTYLPLTFNTSGSERLRIDTSGNPIFTNAFSKVFSITASVASNILSVSLSSCALDFRSTTAATGTTTTVAGTPATLAVPANQSFGISTTTVSNRYAVLCFNNAGTLALGLSPLQGGVQLDETNFLSPTSTVTNTLTTIYSTISASNLAYRVVGFIDVVYVNGTGYSTAPTLVQGVGGQALTSMSSLGYGQTWQNPTRALATTYYNTTGKPIFVFVSGSSSGVNGLWYVTIDGTLRGYTSSAYGTGAVTAGTFIVSPGSSYSVTNTGAGATIASWYELR